MKGILLRYEMKITSDHIGSSHYSKQVVAILVSSGKGGNLWDNDLWDVYWETAEWSLSKYANTWELLDKNLLILTDHKSSYQQIRSIQEVHILKLWYVKKL